MRRARPETSFRHETRLGRALRWATMPGLAALLLMGVWLHQSTYQSPQVYDDYHDRCRIAVEALPTRVGHWMGREIALPQPALDLLSPNALRNIRFTDYSPEALTGPDRRVSVMVVQCRLAKDMQGHYPPRCYPAHGARLVASEPRQWVLEDEFGKLIIAGMEYHFIEPDRSRRDFGTLPADEMLAMGRRRVVLNFMVVPGVGIVQDMKGVTDAAEDYRKRLRGAAQVQVVFDPSTALPDRRERDAILVELLKPALPALRTLMDLPESTVAEASRTAGPDAAYETPGQAPASSIVAGVDR